MNVGDGLSMRVTAFWAPDLKSRGSRKKIQQKKEQAKQKLTAEGQKMLKTEIPINEDV